MMALIKYDYKIYMKQGKFIIPALVFLIFQATYYATGFETFLPGNLLCANILFCIMAWMGFAYYELQDLRTDQIVFLKVKNKNLYWLSKILFMFSVGSIMSLFGIAFPLFYGLLRNTDYFYKDLTVSKVLLGFCILILAAFMGAMLGMIFQKRVVGDRNKGILILVFIILVAVIKKPIIMEYSFAKAITWILPPISDLTNACTKIESFSFGGLISYLGWSIFYIALEIMAYIKVMKKVLF